jgi:hypothetical protein
VKDATVINDGDGKTVLGATLGKVGFAHNSVLEIKTALTGDGDAGVTGVKTALGYLNAGTLKVTSALKPEDVTSANFGTAVSVDKRLDITLSGENADGATSVEIPAYVSVTAATADDLSGATVITVAANAALNATAGEGASAGVYVQADGTVTLGGDVEFAQKSVTEGTPLQPSIGPKGSLTLTGTITFGAGVKLGVSAGSVLHAGAKAVAFPGSTRIKDITATENSEAITLAADLNVPANGVFAPGPEVILAPTVGSGNDAVTSKLILNNGAALYGTVVAAGTTIVSSTDTSVFKAKGLTVIGADTTAIANISGSISGGTITQAVETELVIPEGKTLDLGGTSGTKGASLTLTAAAGSGGAKLTFGSDTSFLLAGNQTETDVTLSGADSTVNIGGSPLALTTLTKANFFKGGTSGNLTKIGGPGSIEANTENKNVAIDSTAAVTVTA